MNFIETLPVLTVFARINPNLLSLQFWWSQMRKMNEDFVCHAIFLAFPSNENVIGYMNDSWRELNIISGKECRIVIFQKEKLRTIQDDKFKMLHEESDWKKSIKDHVEYSAIFAEIFHIEFDAFPCLLLFKDFDAQECTIVSLRDMDGDEIATRMRKIFTIIRKAASKSRLFRTSRDGPHI